MSLPRAIGFIPCLSLLVGVAPVIAQEAPGAVNPLEVPRVSSPVEIDGTIDEAAWADALQMELRYEVRPGENIEPPVRTVVFLAYDDSRVLVAFRAFDPSPERIRARFRDRDRAWQDDWVGIVLDTFNDERRAYEFISNPLGVQTDAINDDVNRRYDISWDAIWESAGRLTDFGYEVEIAIPFSQIRFQNADGPQIWGIDAVRNYPRVDRHYISLFPRDRGANSYLAQERKVIGFEAASTGRNLELVPTLTGFSSSERPDFPDSNEVVTDQSLDLGMTATWGLTPNITLTGTLNPDFSQVEADAIQLAINQRFALFFPEKRPFFLESGDYFQTGLRLLHTRLIADPSAALKITGKSGGHTIGFFSARDEVTNILVPGPQGSFSGSFDSPNTSTVGRYRFDIRGGSTVGAMFTDREGTDGYFNRVASVDAVVRPTDADQLSFDAAWSRTRYSSEMQDEIGLGSQAISGYSLSLGYEHTERAWFVFSSYDDRSDGFRADLGFMPRVGFRRLDGGGGYIWWGDANDYYNRMEAGGRLKRSENQEGELLEQGGEMWFGFSGPWESRFQLELSTSDQVFEGVRFDDLFNTLLFFRVRPSASFLFRMDAVVGDWIDFANVRPADQVRANAFVNLDLGRHFLLQLSHSYQTLDIANGRLFTANVPQMKAVWQFDTRIFVRAIIQYTDIARNPDLYPYDVEKLSRDLFTQLLFSYKLNPRTVVFLGYSESGIETEDLSMTTTNRTLFVKLGYAWVW